VDKEGDLATRKASWLCSSSLEKDDVEVQKWMGVTSKEELIKQSPP
jgi:hypothetical protein